MMGSLMSRGIREEQHCNTAGVNTDLVYSWLQHLLV